MFLSSIRLQNFKCFEDETIELNVPTSNVPGSGLTILVGENNSGKTTIFSALTKLKDDAVVYSLERRNEQDICITLVDSDGATKSIKNIAGSANIEITGESRLSLNTIDIVKDNKFWVGNAGSRRLGYGDYRRQQNYGRESIDNKLASALISVVSDDDLKQRFDGLIKEVFPDFRDWTTDADDPQTGVYIKYKVSENQYVKIDHSVGSGILSVFRIVYAIVAEDTDKVLVIDEPEVYLHPLAQQNLLKVLERESSRYQIVFTTHSPFMFRGVTDAARFVSLTHHKVSGKSVSEVITGFVLPNGPTYGEVTYFVYNMPTSEFHTELYGHISYIHEQSGVGGWIDDFIQSSIGTERPDKRKQWMDGRKDCAANPVTLQTFIRHSIHHPENTCTNADYSPIELSQSISEMVQMIRDLQVNP